MSISAVIQAVLLVVLPVIASAVTAFLLAQAKFLWAKARAWNPSVTALIEEAAIFAVRAAEQAGAGELIEDKKLYALDIAERWLAERSLYIDITLLEAAIEKAVLEQFNPELLAPASLETAPMVDELA